MDDVSFSDDDVGSASDGGTKGNPSKSGRKRGRSQEPSGGRAKSKAKPRAKRPDRHKAGEASKGGKSKRTCRACKRVQDISEFAANQANCMECKRSLDVIAKKARQAGKQEWFQKVKADSDKLTKMVTSYNKAVAEANKAGNKKAAWSVVNYIEEVKAASKVRNIDQGQMMWEDQAIEFWQTAAGGSYSKMAARSKWDVMVDNKEADGTITDEHGPKWRPLRMRIHVGDNVNFENSFGRSKPLGWKHVVFSRFQTQH